MQFNIANDIWSCLFNLTVFLIDDFVALTHFILHCTLISIQQCCRHTMSCYHSAIAQRLIGVDTVGL